MTALQSTLEQHLSTTHRIVRELGGGGMSRVFLAVETSLEREVVIKVLPPELAGGVSSDRFKREMQLVAKLQHPNIVPVLSAGTAGELLYYVMPYIAGESLRAKLAREGALPIEETARLLREVADALAFAHGQGIVHRDIKPDNVLLSSGHALVTDFGVAKALGSGAADGNAAGLTSVGFAMGTPAYMAPEQAMADPHTDGRADLYALGVMGYEMLTGEPPFTGSNPQTLIAAHLTREPDPLGTRRPTVPPVLADLVHRCLAKRPADRYAHARDLLPLLDAVAVQGVAHGIAGSAVLTGAPRPSIMPAPQAIATAGRAMPMLPFLGGLTFLGAAWGVRQALGLPDWLVLGTVSLVVAVITLLALLATRRGGGGTSLLGHLATPRGLATASVVSLVGLAAAPAAFVGLRAAGVGPFSTLLSTGTISERDRILVADVKNSTPDTTLGVALTEALRIDLSQSQVVRLMAPTEIRDALQRMQRPATALVMGEVATEVAAREGAKVVVAAEIAPFTSGYALSARLLDPQGQVLFATRATANTPAEIIPSLETISRDLREALGESLRSIRNTQPLAKVSTSSLEALRLFSQAERSRFTGEDLDRIPIYRQAVALDSTFAMAWHAMYADLNNLRGDPTERLHAAEQVYRFKDRLPAKEALYGEAMYATISGERERVVELYRRIVAQWPDESSARNGIGLYLRALGRYDDAERALREAIAQNRQSSSAYYNLVTTLIPQRKFAAAESVLVQMQREIPASGTRLQAAYFLATSTNRFDEALAFGDSLTRANSAGFRYWGHLYRAEVQWLRGQIAAGRRSTAGASRAQRDQQNTGTALRTELWEIFTDVQLRGDTTGARDALSAMLRATPFDSLPLGSRPWGDLVRLYVATGNIAEALRVRAEYDRALPELWRKDDSAMDRALAELALAQGRPADAVLSARKGAVGCYGCTGDLLGQAFERLGQTDSAIVAYEQAVAPPLYGSGFQNWRPAVVPRALFKLGELYEKTGQRQLARDRYAAFVDLWQNADPALQPAVRTARERLKALAGEG